MLALESERWKELTTFFGEPGDLPRVLQEWMSAVGSEQEQIVYGRDLYHVFLHQNTITNAAFAVVPWIMHVYVEGRTKFGIEYLTDVVCVEANRLAYGPYWTRPGAVVYPEGLMGDYHQAIAEARDLVEDALASEPDEERKDALVRIRPALYGNADLAWKQWRGEPE